MFGKKKTSPLIDKTQIELIANAQERIKQKKRLFRHFVVFIMGSLFMIIANTVFGIGKELRPLGVDWHVYIIMIWLFLFLYHAIQVFIIERFMDSTWEKQQIGKLVSKQQERIDKLALKLLNEPSSSTKHQGENFKNHNQELTIIVAASENNAIGLNNQLIWHLKNDLKHFKHLTNGHHIIMGRKTFESFPKPLPNRKHIVITRQKNYQVPEGVIVVNNLEDAIDASKSDSQPFIIGGGEIYKQALIIADKLELTRVHHDFEADTYFPEIDTALWAETANTFHDKDDDHRFAFSFLTYTKK